MNKKIIAICLCFVIACGIFVGCTKKAADPVSIIVTDENGVAVTDKNGKVVTEMAVPVTDKNGNAVTQKATNSKGEVITDTNGEVKTVIVTEPASAKQGDSDAQTSTTAKQAVLDKETVPYSTTAPENNKTLEEWTFGSLSKVGCNAPNGWNNETVNQLVKEGTDIRVVALPVNFLDYAKYKTADDYAKAFQGVSFGKGSGAKRLSYSKDVYEDGVGIAYLYQLKEETTDSEERRFGKYFMTYIFQTGDRVRVFYVYGTTEEEARTNIADVIANTYYRG